MNEVNVSGRNSYFCLICLLLVIARVVKMRTVPWPSIQSSVNRHYFHAEHHTLLDIDKHRLMSMSREWMPTPSVSLRCRKLQADEYTVTPITKQAESKIRQFRGNAIGPQGPVAEPSIYATKVGYGRDCVSAILNKILYWAEEMFVLRSWWQRVDRVVLELCTPSLDLRHCWLGAGDRTFVWCRALDFRTPAKSTRWYRQCLSSTRIHCLGLCCASVRTW